MTWFTGEATGPITSGRATLHDSVFLAVLVALSCVPYAGGLGLYSDDWTFLAALHGADGSLRGLLAAVMPIELATRPVQGVVLAALYWLFGLEPLGYHVFNCAVLAAAVLLFYHSLRALGIARPIAVVVPLLFGLIPHFSTDRFWIAVFQANVSILLYFLSLYADIRFVGRSDARSWGWKLLGTLALVGSLLAYEVTAVLLLVNVVVLLYVAGARRAGANGPGAHRDDARGAGALGADHWVRPGTATALAITSNVLVLALTIAYKLTTTVRAEIAGGLRYRALRILTDAAPVHFGEYGLALPMKVARALRYYPDAFITAVSVLVGLTVGAYLLVVLRDAIVQFDRRVSWPAVILMGGVLFGAGYGVALMTWEVGFHTTGANNRTAVGAAIGVSWVFAGVIGWVSSRLPSERLRRVAFAGLVALLAASSTLLTNTVAAFWIDAARQQDELITRIRQQFPELPGGTMLLLDGICPFHGPAPVFATGWDTTGMLQLIYDDPTLRGDIVKPNTELTPAGVRTMLFDDVINVYPYGDDLIAFHAGTGQAFALSNIAAARDYIERVSVPAQPACPPYTDGDGVPIY